MAENKKGFILYADQREIFQQIPDELAGKLIKHIFSYVNDENPEVDDLMLNLAFTPIKQALKRDLKKWKEQVEGKKEGAQIGNLKRWHPDLYDDFKSNIRSLEDCIAIAKDRRTSHSDKSESHRVASIAVKDSVKDNDNDNVSVSVKDKDIKEAKPPIHLKVFFDSGLKELDLNGEFLDMWEEFFKIKKKAKASLSEKTLQRQISKLGKLANNDFDKMKIILAKSVDNGWKDFFPLKEVEKESKFDEFQSVAEKANRMRKEQENQKQIDL
jgi:cation transport regulator ChaB